MKNRGKGLIDLEMLEKDYLQHEKYPRSLLPNEIVVNVTNKSAEEVFAEALEIIENTKSKIDYEYEMPDKKCFGTWVKADQID